MGKNKIALIILLLAISPFANAEQVYYCTSEFSIGIKKDKKIGKWKSTGFEVQRYTIKFNDYYTKLDGVDDYTWNCVKPYSWVSEDSKNMIVCYQPKNNGNGPKPSLEHGLLRNVGLQTANVQPVNPELRKHQFINSYSAVL